MTEHDYLLAWSVYAIAAFGCLLVWMRMTRWIWRWLREPLRILMAVLLYTPTIVEPAKDQYAPAVAVTALDIVFKVGGNMWKAASELSMYAMIALVIYVIFALIRWPIERAWRARRGEKVAPAAAVDEDPRTLRERMEAEEAYAPAPPVRSARVEPKL